MTERLHAKDGPISATPSSSESVEQPSARDGLRGKTYDQQIAMLTPASAPIQMMSVYRGGSATDSNLTPRPEKDTIGNKRGLSTFETLEEAARPGGKAQKIETDNLSELNAIPNGGGGNTHVSIRPDSDDALKAWAASRGGDTTHAYTSEVRGAITEEVRRPKV